VLNTSEENKSKIMKKIVLFFIAGSLLMLTGCETTKEISINKDGSGMFVTTNDMSGLIGLAKMSGEGKNEMKELEQKAVDTSIAFASMIDSLKELSSDQKNLMRNGTLGLTIDIKNDKFITKMNFPFTDAAKIEVLDKVTGKIVENILMKQMDSAAGKIPPELGNSAMPKSSIDDYYATTYSKGVISRKLDAAKYAGVKDDDAMKSLQQMSTMGVGNSTLIYNLPSPAKKTEGKNITLSEDKMKVTIENNTDEFFKDGKNLEFHIEY
jgi:hypothetical protein